MLRYDRQTKPGLVALYDIRPGNGAGQFLQPWSLHGVDHKGTEFISCKTHSHTKLFISVLSTDIYVHELTDTIIATLICQSISCIVWLEVSVCL